jgi:hypothetical protein
MDVGVIKTILSITTKIAEPTLGHGWDVINLWIKTHLNTGHALGSGK